MNMKTNKSLRIVIIAFFAVVLFCLVNYCIWDNASASDLKSSNDRGKTFTCEESCRTILKVSDISKPNADCKGRLDKTKYKYNNDNYVCDLQIVTTEWCDEEVFKIYFNTESGTWPWEDVDFKFFITVEDASGNVAAHYTIKDNMWIDIGGKACEFIDPEYGDPEYFKVDSGNGYLLRTIIKNPSAYKGYKVYVDSVWVAD